MNLVVDIGNSTAKWAVFDGDNLLESNVITGEELTGLPDGITRAIISSVGAPGKLNLPDGIAVITLNEQTLLPITNSYNTPETLGKDRLAAAVGASTTYPNENVLSIDCGTCVTYDFMSSSNEYLGGGISPGITMRLKALNTFTERLPLVEAKQEQLIGVSTAGSIRSGVVNGLLEEIKGIINRYDADHGNLKVIITGGDADIFEKGLKNGIFADPHLVLRGLNIILNYNDPSNSN